MGEIDYSKVTALVIEDDSGGLAIISTLLRRMGITTHVDFSGMDVVHMLHDMTPLPDVIFLDLKLRHKTGYEIFEDIRAEEAFKDIKIIAVTAMDSVLALPKCRELGFDGYIAKPLRRLIFIRQVDRVLRGEAVWDS